MRSVTRHGVTTHHATVRPANGQSPGQMFRRLAESVTSADASVAKMYVFGTGDVHAESLAAMTGVFGELDFPVTWVEGECCAGGHIAGVQVVAVEGTPVQTLRLGDRPVGRLFHNGEARICYLGDIGPDSIDVPRGEQARQAFDNAAAALARAGMDFTKVVRTWMYNDRITAWYDEFNAVRTSFYRRWGVFDSVVPASTGIGEANPAAAALVVALMAVVPDDRSVTVQEVPSPLQCSAGDYGSSFSRAVEIAAPQCRTLLVSGTASIAPDGRTVCLSEVAGQVKRTMEVLEALLESRRMSWADVTRAIAYFKQASDAHTFDAYARAANLPVFPVVITQCDICRDDLLFEMELDAVVDKD